MFGRIGYCMHRRSFIPVLYFATLVTVALAACGTLSNSFGPDRIPDAALSNKSSIVVFSAGAPRTCIGSMPLVIFPASATMVPGHQLTGVDVGSPNIRSDYADHPGNLYAIVVPPGSYYFAPGFGGRKVPRYDFSITSGEVLYLGEFFFVADCGRPDFAISKFVVSGTIILRDQWARDASVLARENPQLAQAGIIRRIPLVSEVIDTDKP